MILFYDTETTGLVDDRAPPEAAHQPHFVQLACLLTENDGQERAAPCARLYFQLQTMKVAA